MTCSVKTKLPSGKFVECSNEAKHQWSKGIMVCADHHANMVDQPKVDINERREDYKKMMEDPNRKSGLPAGYQHCG